MTKKHDRDFFFKYVTASTALIVLNDFTFRWNSPQNFNDPFDHQAGFDSDIDKVKFIDSFVESALRVLNGSGRAIGEKRAIDEYFRFIKGRMENFSEDALRKELKIMGSGIAEDIPIHISDKLNPAVIAQLCQTYVFCLAEERDNILMWSHYADNHKGVVFKLRCIDNCDHYLESAEKVNYSKKYAPFVDADIYACHLTGEKPIHLADYAWELAKLKHEDWTYEKEWRVRAPGMTVEVKPHKIIAERKDAFEEIYLGCKIEPKIADDIIKVVKKNLPTARIFKCGKNNKSFKLDFDLIYDPDN